jgi:hypothetical protein
MGWLVKIKFPITLLIVRPSLGPYVCFDTLDCTPDLEIVCLLQGFQGDSHFSPLVLVLSKSTAKTIKGFLSRNETFMQRDHGKLT